MINISDILNNKNYNYIVFGVHKMYEYDMIVNYIKNENLYDYYHNIESKEDYDNYIKLYNKIDKKITILISTTFNMVSISSDYKLNNNIRIIFITYYKKISYVGNTKFPDLINKKFLYNSDLLYIFDENKNTFICIKNRYDLPLNTNEINLKCIFRYKKINKLLDYEL